MWGIRKEAEGWSPLLGWVGKFKRHEPLELVLRQNSLSIYESNLGKEMDGEA